jgi:hypothetical protein
MLAETNTFKPIIGKDSKNNSEMKPEDFLLLLKKGEIFIKYGNYGNPHLRFVQLTEDEDRLIWKTISTCSFLRSARSIDTIEVYLN